MNTLATLALAGAALVLPACGYDSPKVSLASARASERTDEGAAMVFTLSAENSNDVPLPLRDVEYSVELNGQRVFTGTRSAEATLRREGTQSFRLPAVVNLAQTPISLGPARFRIVGTMQYVTPGQLAEVLFDSGVRVPSVEFSGEGEVDLSTAMRVEKLSEGPRAIELFDPPGKAKPKLEPVP